MGSLSFLQGIFPTQGSNPGPQYCRWILNDLSHQGSQRILEWVAFPFSRGSSQPRDLTQVPCIAGGFLTTWATREAKEYWSGEHIPSPGDLTDPGIELGSPALQADSLPTEQSWKPYLKADSDKHQAGYATTTFFDVSRQLLYLWLSAQWTKFYMPTWSCTLAKDTTANIYTDSRFASGLAHDFGTLWKHVFFTSSRNKIKMVLMFRNYWIYYFTYHFSNY